MSYSQILTTPLGWLTNTVITQTEESYHYGSVSGNIIENFYQIKKGEINRFNPISYILLGSILYGALISLLVLIVTIIKKLKAIGVRVFLIWLPIYILLIVFKIDATYTLLRMIT